MTDNMFKVCKGCPVKGARYFDPDGYWCCRHPKAKEHTFEPDNLSTSPFPFVCMASCPVDHWKLTENGGHVQKGQAELFDTVEV